MSLTSKFLKSLNVGDVFPMGELLPGIKPELLWWQVISQRQEPPAIECRVFYMDIPMGVAYVREKADGTIEAVMK